MTDPFVHLHVHTEYSLFDGISRIPDLVSYVKSLGQVALAITDHGVMYGAVYLYKECMKQGIKPIIGCEVYVTRGSRFDKSGEREQLGHLVLLAETDAGYRNLVKICSKGWTEGFYRKPRVDHDVLTRYHEGIIAMSACVAGELPQAILAGNLDEARRVIEFYRDTFGQNNYFIELQNHGLAEEAAVRPELARLAAEYGIGLVATQDFHYIRREDAPSQEIKLCISTGKNLDDPDHFRFANDEFYCKSGEEMRLLLGEFPGAMENTRKIADRCHVTFQFGEHKLPSFDVPEGETAQSYLRKLCEAALPERYSPVTEDVRKRLEYELSVIDTMGFSDYFLIVMDFIHYAKSHGIPIGPGRGSAAGSIVSYLLHITELDPLRFDLLFERFLNPERVSMPDIDTDLCYRGRARVIQYLAQKYGEDHVAQIITFGTLAARAVIRDVGRVMGFPIREVDAIAKTVPAGPGVTLQKTLETSREFKAMYENDERVRKLIDHSLKLEGLSRQSGTHAAGVVICSSPVDDYVPIQLTQDGFFQTQYEKDLDEELGLLKMDLLGLRNLTVIHDAVDMIRENHGIFLDMEALPNRDEATCAMLCAGDTVGVFQSESSGFTSLLMQLAPECFEDLIPMVALYRPGPLGSGMAEDFINRKHGRIPVAYPHPMLEPILQETYGVILYQEQVMRIASVMGGFSLGQADLLRRAMGHKEPEILQKQRDFFVGGAVKNGVAKETADYVFDLMVHFAGYGFNKSHSVCYGWIAWQTAYLKAHYRAEFMAAMMSGYSGDRAKVGRYLDDSRRHGVPILAPHINRSLAEFTAREGAIVFGLAGVQNVGDAAVEAIISAREKEGPFLSLTDFLGRVDTKALNSRAVESLIRCGALDGFGHNRQELLAVLPKALSAAGAKRQDRESGQVSLFEETVEAETLQYPSLPDVPMAEKLHWEKEILGFYISGNPLDDYKEQMKRCTPIEEIQQNGARYDGKFVSVGGSAGTLKKMVTKKGQAMGRLYIEDYTEGIEIVIFPQVWERCRDAIAKPDAVLYVRGRVQADERETRILADEVMLLSQIGEIAAREVHLYVDARHETDAVSGKLSDILKAHHGSTPVVLHLASNPQPIRMKAEYELAFTDEVRRELTKLLGARGVEVRK